MSEQLDYGEQFSASYDNGRTLSDEALKLWMTRFGRYLEGTQDLLIIDVGAGTGRFSFPLASWFQATVIGVEPSSKMRAVALAKKPHPRVRFVTGDAANIPVADASADAALLSMVVHHIPDVRMAARELARVVKPGGYMFIRNAFKGRLAGMSWYRWFPEAKLIDEARLPSVQEIDDTFASAGFAKVGLEVVPQIFAHTFDEFVGKIGSRAISTQKLISDEEFEAGMHRMREAATQVDQNEPVLKDTDLLVLCRLP
ncbi:MAG: class I SAM-dependent methyltransferase [Candidatus Dormibacteraceae bacterium]